MRNCGGQVVKPTAIIIAYYGNLPYNKTMTNTHSHTTTARLEARLPIDAHELLKRAAELQGRTLTDFVVSVASEAARKVIEEVEILRLSMKDQRRIAEALLNPPEPADALRRAAQRYKEQVAS